MAIVKHLHGMKDRDISNTCIYMYKMITSLGIQTALLACFSISGRPSCPKELEPQVMTPPSSVRPSVWFHPHATFFTRHCKLGMGERMGTYTGGGSESDDATPNCPCLFQPQTKTVPSPVIVHESIKACSEG